MAPFPAIFARKQEDLHLMELLLTLKVNVQPRTVAFPSLTTEITTALRATH